MSKHLAGRWLSIADTLSNLKPPFRAKNIAICLASAHRQGWSASRKEEVEEDASAAILLRTIAAEAERTSSWHVPPDLQERVKAWVAERECEQKCEEERDDEEKGD